MTMTSESGAASGNEFVRVGDYPALDFLNTVVLEAGRLTDMLQSDEDVLRWLALAGWPVENAAAPLLPQSLLHTARALRETVRDLVEKRKSGEPGDLASLNAYLAEARSVWQLVGQGTGNPRLERRWSQQTASEILAPLAESAAELLAKGNFDLVRRCESEECVLWFYDRTKSHRRRWCSMAGCGNRHKVAAFRKRKQKGAE